MNELLELILLIIILLGMGCSMIISSRESRQEEDMHDE